MSQAETIAIQPFVFGKKQAHPKEKSVCGFKAACCLEALKEARGQLLEVGCGGGQYLRMLRQHRPDLALHGIDLDPAAVAFAAKDGGLDVACASAEALPYQSQRFSAVVGFDILEHVNDPAMAIREMHRVMKQGGVGFFYVPCEGNHGCIYSILGHHDRKRRHVGHIQRFTVDQVIGLFQAEGFQVRQVRHTDYLIGQIFDYLFFRQLDKTSDPAALWAAQGLELKKGDPRSYLLCAARIIISAATWLEWTLRSGKNGSMGVILTVAKESRA